MNVTASRAAEGTIVMASNGSSAPPAKDRKLAPAACQGLVSCWGSMPSSASACAASGSCAVSCSATRRARPGARPRAW